MLKKVQHLFFKYERHLSSAALVIGFIVDTLTLRRVDMLFENLWIGGYLVISAVTIILLNLYESGRLKSKLLQEAYGSKKLGEATRAHFWLTIILQFAFGGLLSAFTVFYFRSATLSASWPFLLLLVSIFIGNEVLKKQYVRLTFQISLLFISIFSFAIFFVPVLIRQIGPAIFLLSGLISLLVLGVFLSLLSMITNEEFKKNRKMLAYSIGSIFLVMNLMYFTNIIPPIPLSLKDAGVFHSITRNAEKNYTVTYEKEPWYAFFSPYTKYNWVKGEPVYAFSAVFSPAELDTDIVHEWQYFDDATSRWTTRAKIPLSIIGGREGGFRTYSIFQNLKAGYWRVTVKTPQGQSIGRFKFVVNEVLKNPPLEKKNK